MRIEQDGAIKKVLDDGQIDKAPQGAHIGDVAAPFLIGARGLEVLCKHIGIGVQGSIAILDVPKRHSFAGDRANMQLAHQAQDRLVVDGDALLALDAHLDAPVAIGLTGSFIGSPH